MDAELDFDLSFIKIESFKNTLLEFLLGILKQEDAKIRGILLFGSVATGKARDDDEHLSDIDLIIICDELPENHRERTLFKLDATKAIKKTSIISFQKLWWTSKEIEDLVKSKFYLILDAFDEGVILYDPENFLNNLREKLLRDLREKGVIKTDLYWQWPIKKFGDEIEF